MRRTAGFIERFAPEAFDESLEGGESVVSYYNHDANRKLGETATGTLQLTRDARGLRFSIPIAPGDPDHEYVAGKIANRIVRGSSIHAMVIDYSVSRHNGDKIVTITEAALFEVGPVAKPAYSGTSAILRHDEFIRTVTDLDGRSNRERVLRERRFQCLHATT